MKKIISYIISEARIIDHLITEMEHIKINADGLTKLKDEYRRGQGRGEIDVANRVLKIIDYYRKNNDN